MKKRREGKWEEIRKEENRDKKTTIRRPLADKRWVLCAAAPEQ
jgi:hypothetical protein